MMAACAESSSVAASSDHAAARTNGTASNASPPASAGTPNSQSTNTSSCPPRQGISCGDGTGDTPPDLADAQYHAKSGSSRPFIATTICDRKPTSPNTP